MGPVHSAAFGSFLFACACKTSTFQPVPCWHTAHTCACGFWRAASFSPLRPRPFVQWFISQCSLTRTVQLHWLLWWAQSHLEPPSSNTKKNNWGKRNTPISKTNFRKTLQQLRMPWRKKKNLDKINNCTQYLRHGSHMTMRNRKSHLFA